MKKELKIALIFGFIAFLSGFLLVPYQMETLKTLLPPEELAKLENPEIPMPILMLISSIQIGAMTFGLSWGGLLLAQKTNSLTGILKQILKGQKAKWEAKSVFLAIASGFAVSFVLNGLDKWFFMDEIEALKDYTPEFSWLGLTAGAAYGGVVEEVMLRLFGISLIVFLLMKAFKKLHTYHYWIAILLTSLIFGLLHLPATLSFFGELNTIIVIRAILLNGLGGVAFGYLYWKKGFEYGVISHMFTHIFTQLVVIALLY